MNLIKQTSENYSKQKDSKAFGKAGRVITTSLQTSYTAFIKINHSKTGITRRKETSKTLLKNPN